MSDRLTTNLQDLQSIGERMDVQHSKERGLGSAHLLILLDDVNFVENFNSSSRNLRGDLQSLHGDMELTQN